MSKPSVKQIVANFSTSLSSEINEVPLKVIKTVIGGDGYEKNGESIFFNTDGFCYQNTTTEIKEEGVRYGFEFDSAFILCAEDENFLLKVENDLEPCKYARDRAFILLKEAAKEKNLDLGRLIKEESRERVIF